MCRTILARLSPGVHTRLGLTSSERSFTTAMSPDGYCAGSGSAVTQSVLLRPGETCHFCGDDRRAAGLSRATDRL